jgi:hypothetical protein
MGEHGLPDTKLYFMEEIDNQDVVPLETRCPEFVGESILELYYHF